MSMNLIKEQICDVCHKTWQLGWVAANDGNVSARLEDGTFLCTPTGMSKSFITPEKLLRINAKGEVLEGAEGLRPSSEIKMHLRCYEKRPDVWSVIHAHPPGATGFAVAHKAMDMYNMIEDVAVIGFDDIQSEIRLRSFDPLRHPQHYRGARYHRTLSGRARRDVAGKPRRPGSGQ